MGAWADTDAATKAELRRECDLLWPDPDRCGLCRLEDDLDRLMAAIWRTHAAVSRQRKPTGAEFKHAVVATVRRVLTDAGLTFDAKSKGPAALLLDALLPPGGQRRTRYLIEREMAKAGRESRPVVSPPRLMT
jgi:hypothetical protein